MEINKGHVIIAGAGPGDPDLISVKALKALRNSDVILYDALVNTELLENAPSSAILIFVGKRKGRMELPQQEINELIFWYASRYKRVLRLKGGDPFVFGRGHEEFEYLFRRGITAEVIPGISSALAAPLSAGIPVTKRGVNESFWVVTGMVSSAKFSSDLELAAQSSATVVILMGITHLAEIMKLFVKFRSPSEPVAVIQNASCANQISVIGNAATMADLVSQHAITSPAVIVVGKVVRERNFGEILLREEVKLKVAV
jgi:uroporphyrin-III C-methyltransferase